MKSLNRFRLPGALVLLMMGALLTPAQWDKKPYTEWSEKEAQKLLDDSPWGQTQTFATQTSGSAPSASSSSRVFNTTQVNFRIRLFSAKPVRQAFSRIVELRQKGNVSPQLAEQLKALANADFPDYVIITVVCDADQRTANFQEVTSILMSRTTADLKNNTFLEVKGRRVYLQEYQPPRNDGTGARLIFPRLVDGKPFITPESGEIHFYSELSRPAISTSPNSSSQSYTLNQRFKVSAMSFQGKLEY